jgi:hypothetical protein
MAQLAGGFTYGETGMFACAKLRVISDVRAYQILHTVDSAEKLPFQKDLFVEFSTSQL